MGERAQPEIVVSRLLWAIGFYQPALYYVAEPGSSTADAGIMRANPPRLPPESGHQTEGDWPWVDNPIMPGRSR